MPIEPLAGKLNSQDGNDYVKASTDAAEKGADLFSIASSREARKRFELARDYQGQRLAQLNEALAMRRLGHSDAGVVACLVYADAKRVNDVEIIEAVRSSFPEMCKSGGDGDTVLTDLNTVSGNSILTVQSDRPFVLDESSGKIIGGSLASEALAEFAASKALNEAWSQEFPGVDAPFSRALSAGSFEWRDPSFQSETPTGTLDLGQTIWLTPLDGTLRLARAEVLEVPAGYTTEGYATEFVSRVTAAIMVAHKRLRGAFLSETGTSISAGNVSTRGHVFDYETFQSPTLGDEGDLSLAQIQDLCMVVYLIHTFLQKLRCLDLMAEMLEKCALTYAGKETIDLPLMESITQIARGRDQIQQHRALVSQFAKMLYSNAVWRA